MLHVLSYVSAFYVYCITVCNHYKSVKNKNSEFHLKSGTETTEKTERGRLCFSSAAVGTEPEAAGAEMCQGNRDTEKPNWNHHLPSHTCASANIMEM